MFEMSLKCEITVEVNAQIFELVNSLNYLNTTNNLSKIVFQFILSLLEYNVLSLRKVYDEILRQAPRI